MLSFKIWRKKKRKKPPSSPPSDYDRTIKKLYNQKQHQKKKSGKTIPQLGTQANQSTTPFKVLSDFEKNLLQWSKETNLIPAQLRGEDDIQKHKGIGKWKFVFGKELVWPQLVDRLPTRMYKLHQWYMQASAEGQIVLEVWIGKQYFFCGEAIIHVPLEEFYFLFNQDALDKTLVSCYVL